MPCSRKSLIPGTRGIDVPLLPSQGRAAETVIAQAAAATIGSLDIAPLPVMRIEPCSASW